MVHTKPRSVIEGIFDFLSIFEASWHNRNDFMVNRRAEGSQFSRNKCDDLVANQRAERSQP